MLRVMAWTWLGRILSVIGVAFVLVFIFVTKNEYLAFSFFLLFYLAYLCTHFSFTDTLRQMIDMENAARVEEEVRPLSV